MPPVQPPPTILSLFSREPLREQLPPTPPGRRHLPCTFCCRGCCRLCAGKTRKREATGDDPGVKPKKRDDNSDSGRTKANPADAQARVLDRLREKLDVTDDTEWALIMERMTTIDEIRRTLWTSSASSRGPLPGTEKNKRKSGSSGNPERDALRSAVSDNLPDAEIKSRLARAHEIHRRNEARLAQAQANLRAVLSIRQEAVVVMAGILPP